MTQRKRKESKKNALLHIRVENIYNRGRGKSYKVSDGVIGKEVDDKVQRFVYRRFVDFNQPPI